MGLNGIDISSRQGDLVVSKMATCDFVIVKATSGAGYANECFKKHAYSCSTSLVGGNGTVWASSKTALHVPPCRYAEHAGIHHGGVGRRLGENRTCPNKMGHCPILSISVLSFPSPLP